MSFLSRAAKGLALGFVLATSVGSTGCIKKTLAKGQIKSTREASAAFQQTAEAAKVGCPVSKALAGTTITLNAELIG